jgi:hypothetical protein
MIDRVGADNADDLQGWPQMAQMLGLGQPQMTRIVGLR